MATPAAPAGLRIGLMGGSFNPPHAGHVAVARAAMRRLELDRLWLLVSPGNPLKSHNELARLDDRVTSLQRLLHSRRMLATGIEARLGTRYTVDTLAVLRRRFPAARFVWVMGADGLAEMHRWRNWREIASLVAIAVVDRPGWRFKALASPAARTLARSRLDERLAARLPFIEPPAWTYLSIRLSPQSSSAIRARMRP